MKYAIIAAGEGSRLQHEGIALPKPLVHICGEAMIDRLIRIFRQNGATEIVIIVNTLNPLTEQHIRQLKAKGKADDIRLVVKSGPFCLTTVDTIFNEQEFKDYIYYFNHCPYDGCMAVTDFVDDEKPLYVATDKDLNITGFHDTNEGDQFISGGIYCLRPNALNTLNKCLEQGQSRMRNYQRALVADGLKLKAFTFAKILDVDHASDISKAEDFLQHK